MFFTNLVQKIARVFRFHDFFNKKFTNREFGLIGVASNQGYIFERQFSNKSQRILLNSKQRFTSIHQRECVIANTEIYDRNIDKK